MWTQFMDMHSGGGTKEPPYEYIYIEAPEHEAKLIFFNRFGHNPERVSCTCCGEDYSIHECETLEQATAYERGCKWNETTRQYEEWAPEDRHLARDYQTLDEYLESDDILVIYADQIEPKERKGSVPQQGYVYID